MSSLILVNCSSLVRTLRGIVGLLTRPPAIRVQDYPLRFDVDVLPDRSSCKLIKTAARWNDTGRLHGDR